MFGLGKKKKKGDAPEAEEAEGAAPPAEGEGAEGEGAAKKKMSGKKLVLFIILPAVLVLGGGGTAAFLLLSKGGEQHAEAEAGGHEKAKGGGHGEGGEAGEAIPGPNGTTISYGENVVFVQLPEMLVNINGPDGRPAYLKLKLTLEVPDEATVATLGEHIPRISDQFNGFLRELRTDDLAGSAGAYRLRLELLRRANLVIAPAQVNAVLIEEMLVQ
ncbi:MAG: flagellar basal body-associated FliL family protein [Hyphomonadaceae bacterium]|nr:flagellar basal body-associated FliL family protein [Hyphomonadaceae bacterium]